MPIPPIAIHEVQSSSLMLWSLAFSLTGLVADAVGAVMMAWDLLKKTKAKDTLDIDIRQLLFNLPAAVEEAIGGNPASLQDLVQEAGTLEIGSHGARSIGGAEVRTGRRWGRIGLVVLTGGFLLQLVALTIQWMML